MHFCCLGSSYRAYPAVVWRETENGGFVAQNVTTNCGPQAYSGIYLKYHTLLVYTFFLSVLGPCFRR